MNDIEQLRIENARLKESLARKDSQIVQANCSCRSTGSGPSRPSHPPYLFVALQRAFLFFSTNELVAGRAILIGIH